MNKICYTLFFILFVDIATAQNDVYKEQYVGHQKCVSCHQQEVNEWQGSHHDKAMQHAQPDTVLGDFEKTVFENFGLFTTFYKQQENNNTQYWVRTDGPDGQLQDYQIKYTFGVYPLQQYLIEFPGGRLQALDIAWDARSKAQGGQRWFHLHPKEKIESDDILHWTGPNMNWNYMCAYCHSTHLEKNYQPENDTYNTTYSEINVSCEACHGPAVEHIKWANAEQSDVPDSRKNLKNKGLTNPLNERDGIQWQIDPKTQKPYRSKAKQSNHEIETCARCHSRRTQLANDAIHQPLMNAFRPVRLSSSLYYPDGQPKDEVYVYGSFIQSKMNHAGVTCSDCHDPHSNELKLPGDQICNQCHLSEIYRSETHHHHKTNSTSCIDCHMSATTYMGVDARNDHSFRIPRPDLSINTDIPNACNQCHTTNTSQWSAQHLLDWYQKRPIGFQKFASALSASQQQEKSAQKQLSYLINNKQQPLIARATALEELINYPNQASLKIISRQLQHKEPMIRLAALEALSGFNIRTQISLAFSLIYDETGAVRMEAARLLASVPVEQLLSKDKKQFEKTQQEYLQAQLYNAERPESQVNLGHFYYQQGKLGAAENAYKRAIYLQQKFAPAYLALAQLLSQSQREEEAQLILTKGIINIPENASIHHALGLSYIRQNKLNKALFELAYAANLEINNRRYQFVYAIALNSSQQTKEALSVLDKLHQKFSDDSEILISLITINKEAGNRKQALSYAYKLNDLMPGNQNVKNLINELKR